MDFFIELSERAWKANRDGDAAFYDSYLTDDPVAISPWGVETDRAAILRTFAENENPYTRTDQSEHRVVTLTDSSVVHSSRVEIDSARGTMTVYATTTLVRNDAGTWRAAVFQITPVA
ncbi:nuclear transport factor 2 family protein [Herbidospora cretacea]|uniref:nuclear transport factor 2 family protein n=1 Tax=Herbidospora cretacea TaxID=28444 RepID=UPI000773FD34|nr:nuclear transport factor 2 family protein [Herbidospora cretacea]